MHLRLIHLRISLDRVRCFFEIYWWSSLWVIWLRIWCTHSLFVCFNWPHLALRYLSLKFLRWYRRLLWDSIRLYYLLTCVNYFTTLLRYRFNWRYFLEKIWSFHLWISYICHFIMLFLKLSRYLTWDRISNH